MRQSFTSGVAIGLMAICLSLGACETHVVAVPTVTVACLPIPTYTPQFENDLTAAVAALAPTSPLIVATADYLTLRAQDRACQATNSGTLK